MADPFHDKVREDLMRSVSAILPYALRREKWSNWVLKKLYPIFLKNIENKNEKIGLWAIKKVGQIASMEPSLENEAEKEFLEIWFSNKSDPSSEFGNEVMEQLAGLTSKRLFEIVRAKAKDHDTKVKAEILLERLKEGLLPR